MKIKHLLPLAFAAVLASCSTAYRSGQTPDDVYYSPAPEQPTYQTSDKSSDYVTTESDQDRNSYNYRNDDEENEIRRGIQDPIYRNSITFGLGYGGYIPYSFSLFGGSPFGYSPYGYDPFTPYAYNPYGYGFNSPYKSFVYNDMIFSSPYYNYGYYPYSYGYNPYSFGYSPFFYSGYYPGIYSPAYKTINTNTGVRRYNLNAYNNTGSAATRGTRAQPVRTVTTQPNNGSVPVRSTTGTTQPTRGTGVGNVIRRVFTPSNRSYTNPNNNRTYNNSRVYNNDNSRVYNNDNSRTYNNDNSRSYTPERSYQPSAPSSSSSSGSSSAPVRTFRR